MTWKEFKTWAARQGVKDEDQLDTVEFVGQPTQAVSVDDYTDEPWWHIS